MATLPSGTSNAAPSSNATATPLFTSDDIFTDDNIGKMDTEVFDITCDELGTRVMAYRLLQYEKKQHNSVSLSKDAHKKIDSQYTNVLWNSARLIARLNGKSQVNDNVVYKLRDNVGQLYGQMLKAGIEFAAIEGKFLYPTGTVDANGKKQYEMR